MMDRCTYRIAGLFRRTLLAACFLALANASSGQDVDHDASWQIADQAVNANAHADVEEDLSACPCENGQPCRGVCRDPGFPAKPKCDKPGDIDRGDCPPHRYRIGDCKRSGKAHCVAPWAQCSITDKYSAWFVGGGAAFCKGRPRKKSEGTWGLDYKGVLGRANVWLKYTQHRRQGGD